MHGAKVKIGNTIIIRFDVQQSKNLQHDRFSVQNGFYCDHQRVGIYLTAPVFPRGRLYVAFSQVSSFDIALAFS